MNLIIDWRTERTIHNNVTQMGVPTVLNTMNKYVTMLRKGQPVTAKRSGIHTSKCYEYNPLFL